MADDPKITALLLTQDGKELALGAVESLQRLEYPELRVAVVDNGSQDGTHSVLRSRYPTVQVLRSESDLGISGALTMGARSDLAKQADLLLVLYDYADIDPWCLKEAVKVLQTDPEVGCVGPKIHHFFDREYLWGAGGEVVEGVEPLRFRGAGELDRGQYDEDVEVDFVDNCGMLARTSALKKVGYWDVRHTVGGFGAADLCLRLRAAGYSCMYAHGAVIWRMATRLPRFSPPRHEYHCGRSNALFQHHVAPTAKRLRLLLAEAAAVLKGPTSGVRQRFAHLHGALSGFLNA